MKTFVWHNGKPQAMRSFNDDLIMACAIGCWVKDTAFEVNQKDLQYKKAFLNSLGTSSKMMNTAIPGMSGYKKTSMQKQKDNYDKFVWLLKG